MYKIPKTKLKMKEILLTTIDHPRWVADPSVQNDRAQLELFAAPGKILLGIKNGWKIQYYWKIKNSWNIQHYWKIKNSWKIQYHWKIKIN